MKLVIENPAVDPREIDRAVRNLVNDSHRDDFRDISVWMIRTGLGEKGARETLIRELSEHISKEISNGLVQVTVQTLEDESEIRATIAKDLPVIYPRIDFVVKSGAIDVWNDTYWFKVTSKVTLNDLAIRMRMKEITAINSGTLQAFVTLAYCGHDRENKSPFTLFEDKKVMDLDLAKVVTFR